MRMLLKIMLFPITLVLSVFVAVSNFIVIRCAVILNIISGVVFFGALTLYLQYFFGFPFGEAGQSQALQGAIITTVMAFLISPYGLPALAALMLDKIGDLNEAIKSI